MEAETGGDPRSPVAQTGQSVEALREAHTERMSRDEVLSIAYHRNGIGGDGFFVALVRCHDLGQRVLTSIVPAWAVEAQNAARKCPSGCYPCYAIDPGLAAGPWTKPGNIAFGENSWRGDLFFNLVVKAAKAWQQ